MSIIFELYLIFVSTINRRRIRTVSGSKIGVFWRYVVGHNARDRERRRSNSDRLGQDPAQPDRWQRQERMTGMGILRLPQLYDQPSGTEWSDEFSERLDPDRERRGVDER